MTENIVMERLSEYLEKWNKGLLLPGLSELKSMAENGSSNVLVAILDTPIDGQHITLQAKGINDGPVVSSHGTHIASVIAGHSVSKGCEYSGIAPAVSVISIPIYASGTESCDKTTLADAIEFACDKGADIINVSGGQFDRGLVVPNKLTKAVSRAVRERRLIVSAAGNDGEGIVHTPAYLPGVLGVGAADWNSKPMHFSNYGQPYKGKTILAPGHCVPGADVNVNIRLMTGTSFATPIVSGVAALLLSYASVRKLGLDALSIGELIVQSSEPAYASENISEERILAGRLNVLKATRLLTNIPTLPSTKSSIQPSSEEPPMSEELPVSEEELLDDVASANTNEDSTLDDLSLDAQVMPVGDVEVSPASYDSNQVNNNTGNVAMTTTPQIEPNSISEPRESEQKVFAMGTIGFDFQIAARQDYFLQRIVSYTSGTLDERFFKYFLESNCWEETELLTWVLKVDGTPVYALKPCGVNLIETYKLLASCLYFQMDKDARFKMDDVKTNKQRSLLQASDTECPSKITDDVNRAMYRDEEIRVREISSLTSLLVDWVAISGSVIGETKLFNGDVVPLIAIAESGVIPWDKRATIAIASQQACSDNKLCALMSETDSVDDEVEEALSRALDKIYYEFKNNGVTDEDRAINYVGTNILSMADVFSDVFTLTEQGVGFGTKYEFESYYVEKSKVQRPTGNLMDVILKFFEPGNLDKAYKCYRFTVDVADVNPVIIGGKPKQYFESSTRSYG